MSTIPTSLGRRVVPPDVLDNIFLYAAYAIPYGKRRDLRLVAKRFNTLLVPVFKATSLRFEDQEQLTHALAQPNGPQHAIYIDASRLSGADKKPIQELIRTSSHARGLAFWSIPDVVEQLAALPHLEVFSIRFTYDFGVGVDVCTDDGFIQPVFKSLTHLYCDYIAPWADDEYNADFPIAAFPVLTHAAFNLLNLETVENAHPELMFDGAEKFLKTPSLQKLIFRIDRLPEEYHSSRDNADFLDECRQWLNTASEQCKRCMSDPRIVVVRMVFNHPGKEENHFDFLDRLWKMSQDEFETL